MIILNWLCCVVIFNVLYLSYGSDSFKYVKTNSGDIKGYKAKDGDYFAFLGIPYAAPSVGENRFKAPKPIKRWNGTLEATKKVICPQLIGGNEDCLILNIFTPLNVEKLLPVIFYIHGGSFIMGKGNTEGVHPLVEKDVIVVTINYRLGALGFLCLNTEEAPGNAGLKDQITALKWVKSNIEQFGGDPNAITIYGMSAGSASVEYLILSPMTKGLFSNAILESSSSMSVYSKAFNPIGNAKEIANMLGFSNTENLKDLAKFYQSVDIKNLVEATFNLYNNNTNGDFVFVPCIEKNLIGVEPLITKEPLDILIKNNYNKVPILFAYVTLEGLFMFSEEFYTLNYKDRMNSKFADFLPIDLEFDSDEIKEKIAENVKKFYFGNKNVSKKTLLEYLLYIGDLYVLHPLLYSVKMHEKNTDKATFLLEFAYRGEMGGKDDFYRDFKFAGHGDMVKHAILGKEIKNNEDRIAVERVSTIISNFAKFGHPLPSSTDILNITWPPVSKKMEYLYLDKSVKIFEDPYSERMKFWDVLYQNFRRRIKV